ncbi:hypothetical protein AB4072_02275 [Microvirga sp. 2MCAF38]|uniref:hypothetical protein n=1 Tax=Microvirga sp. 2MCAF38 TaxID=3232989 RepID=UPI003F94D53D
MITTSDIETILAVQDLPPELLRSLSSAHASDEPRVASMVSGMMVEQQEDQVICPLLLQRHLVVPARSSV